MLEKNIKVDIIPASVQNFTKWKLVSESSESVWFEAGKTTTVYIGDYTIVGEIIPGWTIDKNNIEITIDEDYDEYIYALKYTQHGNLKVIINDGGAKTEGRWRVLGTSIWFSDGDEIDLAPNSYEIEFKEIDFYVKPSNSIVAIKEGQVSVLNITYVACGTVRTVLSVPGGSSNGRWRIKDIDDTNWYVSGTSITNLPPNDYIIEFNIVNSIYTYKNINVTVTSGNITSNTVVFEGLKVLAIPTLEDLYIYNYNNFQRRDLLEEPVTEINQVAFNRLGTLMVLVSNKEPYIMFYNCPSFEVFEPGITPPTSGCRSVCFNSDGTHLAISQNVSPYLIIYNTSTWTQIVPATQPTSYCSSMIFNSVGNLVVGYDKSPYMSVYNGTNFSSIAINTIGLSRVLSLKNNGSDLLVGHQQGIKAYNSSNVLKTISSFSSITNNINGIEIVGDKIIMISSSYPYVYQFDATTYTEIKTPLFEVEANVNTWIKTDSEGKNLLIGSLRDPGIYVYDTSTWLLVDLADDLQYCKKFDISGDLSINDPANTYYLKIICNPDSGQWKLSSEDIWYSSGYSTPISESDTIVFNSVNNYTTPANLSITIPGSYNSDPDPNVTDVKQILKFASYEITAECSLKVFLNIGRWKPDGFDDWIESGTLLALSAGSYQIIFEEVTGYIKPDELTVNISENENKNIHIQYTDIRNNCINILINPAEVHQFVQYRVRNSSDEGLNWSEWSDWNRYFDDNTFAMITLVEPNLYEVEVKSENSLYQITTASKIINYKGGIGSVSFEFTEVVPPENSITINVAPLKVYNKITNVAYRYTNNQNVTTEWILLEKE